MPSRRGIRLKGLKRYSVNGRDYVYHRASGLPLPSDIPESDPAFLAAYLEAENAKPKTRNGPGSIESIANEMRKGGHFRTLSAAYQKLIWREVAKIIEKGGHVPAAQVRQKHILADIQGMAPNAANKRLKAWRLLCKQAGSTAADGIKAVPTQKTQGHAPWEAADIASFRATWPIDTMQRLAFELVFWTGARVSDAVRLGPGMVDKAGWLTFRQKKTGGQVSVPFDRALPDFADAETLEYLHSAIAANPRHMTFITTEKGAARTEKGASQWIAKAARKAGVTGKAAHGLRKSRAISLAENGATTHQIAAWTGHETLAEVEHYSKAAQKKRLLSGAEGERDLSKKAPQSV